MPNKNSPPKHKTPNHKLKPYSIKVWNVAKNSETIRTYHSWEPQPLRSTRKDLACT